MGLVGEAGLECELGERRVAGAEGLAGVLEAAHQEIAVGASAVMGAELANYSATTRYAWQSQTGSNPIFS